VKPHRDRDLTNILNLALVNKNVGKAARDVLVCLIRDSGPFGTATITKQKIAEPLSVSTKTVQRAFASLKREGLIERLRQGTSIKGKNRPAKFRLCDSLRIALGEELGTLRFYHKCPPPN
jgi:predicted transcriptional regulator